MNRKRMWILLALISVLALTCGTVAALMFRQTNALENQFEYARVSCRVEEAFDGEKKTSITVQNTGNIPAQIRVRLVSYWVSLEDDGSTRIVGIPSEPLEIEAADGWVAMGDNTFVYTSLIEPNAFTPNLLKRDLVLQEKDGYLQVVEVFADAIQGNPSNAVDDRNQAVAEQEDSEG